jgi:beta-barrel assembly-enhancing protease
MAHHVRHHIPIRHAYINQANSSEAKQQIVRLNHAQELEADAFGYQYAVQAGFDPQRCLRSLKILAQLPGSLIDSNTHPSTPRRIEAMDKLIAEDFPKLQAIQGRSLLNNSEPLNYDWSSEKQGLRINSDRGGCWVFPENNSQM